MSTFCSGQKTPACMRPRHDSPCCELFEFLLGACIDAVFCDFISFAVLFFSVDDLPCEVCKGLSCLLIQSKFYSFVSFLLFLFCN